MWSDVGAGVFRLVADVCGAATAGGAVFAAFVIPGPVSGAVGPPVRAALRPVRWAALGWAGAASATALVDAAARAPVFDLAGLAGLAGLVGRAAEPTAWLVSSVLAVAVAVAAWMSRSWRSVALVAGIAVIGLLPPVVVGPVSVGPDRDLATGAIVWLVPAASVWLGSAAALLLWSRRGERCPLVLSRYRRLRLVCAVTTVVSGAISGFLALVAAPTVVTRTPSAQILILGYELPRPPNPAGLLLDWRPDLLFGPLAVLAVVGYLAGVRRLRGRGDRWPHGRVIAWVAGWLLIVVATSSGLAVHAPGSFSLHLAGHLLMNMLGPALLAVAGPVTLALRALPATSRDGPAGARTWLVALLHAPLTRFASHPLVAFSVFVGSYYLLYFTGLFPAAMRIPWAHQLMNVHFVLTGYLYYWVVVGTDPPPRPLPHLAKLGLLFSASPFHILFAVLVLNSHQVIGETFYRALALAWPRDPFADQRLGGALVWAGGELPLLITVVVLLVQWTRHDDRLDRRRLSAGPGGLGGLDDDHQALLEMLAARRARR